MAGGRLLVDAGANTNVNVENLVQFAQMGSIYMHSVMGIAAPKVGLINNGSEETKGSELTQAAYQRLAEHNPSYASSCAKPVSSAAHRFYSA